MGLVENGRKDLVCWLVDFGVGFGVVEQWFVGVRGLLDVKLGEKFGESVDLCDKREEGVK